jgi:hypothetical protein
MFIILHKILLTMSPFNVSLLEVQSLRQSVHLCVLDIISFRHCVRFDVKILSMVHSFLYSVLQLSVHVA